MIVLFGKAPFGAETSEGLVDQALGDRRVAGQSMGQPVITPPQSSRMPPQQDASGDPRFDPATIAKHKQLGMASLPSNLRQGREIAE